MTIHKKGFISIFTLALVLIAGLIFRLWLAQTKPIWLDEQYSLFYANDLKTLSAFAESHSPIYYFLLSPLLQITNSLFLLRVISSVLPAFVGIILTTILFLNDKKKSFISTLIIACFLSFNPFLIDISVDLRMYGLVILFSLLQYFSLAHFLNKKNLVAFALLLITLFISNFVDYPLLISGFFILCTALLHAPHKTNRKLITIAFFILISAAQFFISLGSFNLKSNLEYSYNWIPQPSVDNILPTVLNLLGFIGKSQSISPLISIVVFCLLIFVAVLQLKRTNSHNKSYLYSEVVTLFSIPVFTIILVSLLLNWLSHRYFFYQFIPSVSLFLPRVMTAYNIYLMLAIARKTTQHRSILIGSLIIIFYFVTINIVTITNLSTNLKSKPNDSFSISKKNTSNTIFYPAWSVVQTIAPQNLSVGQSIANIMEKSEHIEQSFNYLRSTNATLIICDQLIGNQLYILNNVDKSIKNQTLEFKSAAATCCVESKQTALFTISNCLR